VCLQSSLFFAFAVCAIGGAGLEARQIKCGILIEEAVRLQDEADLLAWHDGPILKPHNVMHTERVPDDDVLIGDVAVSRNPPR
jgi:hypothetical protein